MKDNQDYNDSSIRKIRLFLSIGFALGIYLPAYILFPPTRENIFRDISIIFVSFLIALIAGYYLLYNRLWLKKFIYKSIPFYRILLFYLGATTLTGTLLWWIPTANVYLSFALGPVCAFFGAVLGFIIGLMSSIVILIARMKNTRDYDDKFIRKVRLLLSAGFALTVYLIGYLLILFAAENIFFLLKKIGIICITFVIVAITGYYSLYNRLWLKKFISKETPSYQAFLFYLLAPSIIGALLWEILGIIDGVPKEGWSSVAFCGAILGLIIGIMSSIVIAILRKDPDKNLGQHKS